MGEDRNLLPYRTDHAARAARMRRFLSDFMASCKKSWAGGDYPEPCEPINAFQEITGGWDFK